IALRLIIGAQSHLSTPTDYLTWRPEAAKLPSALQSARTEQLRDYNVHLVYHSRATTAFPLGVAGALAGLFAVCLSAVPSRDAIVHTQAPEAWFKLAPVGAALLLLLSAAIAVLQI